jgi:hypothetical protein
VAIAGAGFGGLCMAIQLQKAGINDFLILEKAKEVGGAWRDNHYPGAACDVQSHMYSYSFDTKSDWTLNKWEGWDWRRLEWPRPDLGPGWYSWKEGPGRVALAVHETMHAMGFGHVTDFTSIMYPQGGLPNNQGKFSPGDLAGLQTLYLSRPCGTVTASSNTPSASSGAAATPATGVALEKVARGTKVVNSSVSPQGVMSATVKTPLARGSKVTIRVTGASTSAATSVTRVVQSGGIVRFTRVLTADSTVELRDSRGRALVTWKSAP